MRRSFYSDSISNFLSKPTEAILGEIATNNAFSLEIEQKDTWLYEIALLKDILTEFEGAIFFEYSIPRMGKRIDVVLIINNIIFIIEFKVGEKKFPLHAIDQVFDYSLDLKNFHETSHAHLIVPILVCTEAQQLATTIELTPHNDLLTYPIKSNSNTLKEIISTVLLLNTGQSIDISFWQKGRYSPTPSIIEAAMALYNGHSVVDITRAEAMNLSDTTKTISDVIHYAKQNRKKAICFVTGVPGAGKTLVGLDIATKHFDKGQGLTSVFLSGNGPLVAILREALTRDKVKREKEKGNKVKKGEVLSNVKAFIQNVHHFRDECLIDEAAPPFDHIAIFDEAQRAWNHTQTANFMKRKKKIPNFAHSEPEFLISCLDRHKDWAVIVCLVGGGQEINTGEAGINEWLLSLNRSFPKWEVYISDKLVDEEYAAGNSVEAIEKHGNLIKKPMLHLSVSLRSFRAENVSNLIKCILDLQLKSAKSHYEELKDKYPIVLTRDITKAKEWLKQKARGSERYGIVVSSKAQRLKPYAIDVKSPIDPVNWFLNGKDNVKSSYYLEDVATEFHVQGLELDWACVTWDADFRYADDHWQSFSLTSDGEGKTKWNTIKAKERKLYQKNAYRVLLTRARQGMIIVVPEGDENDHTRKPEYYDKTFQYLKEIGLPVLM